MEKASEDAFSYGCSPWQRKSRFSRPSVIIITLFHMTEIVVSTRANSFDTGVAAEYFVRPIAGHFIVFVIYNGKFEDVTTFPEVFIVPSTEVPAITKCWNEEKRVMKGSLASYKNRWDLLLKSRVFRPFYPFYGPLRGPSSNHPLCGW
jgi:hypothetical protein